MNDLWKSLNLAENNQDPGGGLLYFMRYTPEMINLKRDSIIGVLEGHNIDIIKNGEKLGIKVSNNDQQISSEGIYSLLEELSIINEAQEYMDAGIGNISSIAEITTLFTANYYTLLSKKNLPDAYNLLTMGIPQFINKLKIANNQNKVLSKNELNSLGELLEFSINQESILNTSEKYIFMYS